MTETGQYHQTAEQIDAELDLVRAAQEDPRKFEPLYRNYYTRIVGYVYHRLDDKETAFEITAQVFYHALNNLSRFKAQGVPFGAWLFRIAYNELNQWFRKEKTRRSVHIDSEGIAGLKESLEDISTAAQDAQLFEALQTLDSEEMEMIDMRFFEKRSFREISGITGLGESACKMRIYRAIEKLRTHFQKD